MATNASTHASDKPGLHTEGTTTIAMIDATLRPDLWQLAYNKFSVEEPKLVQKYERMLSKDTESTGNEDLQTKMSSILSRKLDEMASRQWSIKWKGKPRQVREQVDRIVKVVRIGKDFGSAAAGLDPIHAGLPWAGVCVLLQVCSCPTLGFICNNSEILSFFRMTQKSTRVYWTTSKVLLKSFAGIKRSKASICQ